MKQVLFLFLFISTLINASNFSTKTSVAGFYQIENSGRNVYNFNTGWKYYPGDIMNAWSKEFNDSNWAIIATPHTQELTPAEASGGRNFQKIVWYRKHFVVPQFAVDQELILHFEAIMGKQNFYVNGKLIKSNKGGYLPITLNLSELGIQSGEECLIAVSADNSNDKSYPPGKPQYTLDFQYHGGIYRDVWLICRNKIAVTDAIESNKTAGGGIFVHYDKISETSAEVQIQAEIQNKTKRGSKLQLEFLIKDRTGNTVKTLKKNIALKAGISTTENIKTTLFNPQLWSPESPYLYDLEFRIKSGSKVVDGGKIRIGIRKVEFKGKDGFYLNGKKYHQLIGGNRHQDFAYVGNAVPNSQQWRDAKRLRDAGCTIIRTAHYPQDPSFMDACDEFGIFIIVATPGWQYFNKEPEFSELSYQYTREIIRRDRNHASVLMWEPILNETRFPLEFSLKALQITKDEYPFAGAPPAAADMHSAGVSEHYGVVYGWPEDEGKVEQCIFTREFGENVDDWYAHNANNRAARHWGEKPMKTAALSLADTYGRMHHTSGQFIGGALWHPFDHQRGYHPDPYWGGIFDAFRQPKYAYYLFKSQVDPNLEVENVSTGAMTYIVNEMTPFSDADVVVFSNCDSVRLIAYDSLRVVTKAVVKAKNEIPYAPVVFENMFDFWEMRDYTYKKKQHDNVKFVAEGIIGDKVVCRDVKMPSRRSTKIRLSIDELNHDLIADGSDFIVVVAEITDDMGNVRRLAKENIVFSVEGEGEIMGDASIGANPRAVEFGSAPVLIRSTTQAGKIKVKAHVQFEGTHAPSSAEIEFESTAPEHPFCALTYDKKGKQIQSVVTKKTNTQELSEDEKRKLLNAVEQQQAEFGIK